MAIIASATSSAVLEGDWNGFLFHGCPYCGNKWHSFEFPTVQLPSYQLATLGPEQVDAIFDILI